MINSQIFRFSKGAMHRKGYLNLKFISGTSLKSGESLATPEQVGPAVSEMMHLAPWTRCVVPTVFRRWKHHFHGDFFRPNWYLPPFLGGYGVDVEFAPSSMRVTRGQRQMAARFIADPRLQLIRRLGLSIPTAKYAGALAHWRLVRGPYVPLKEETRDESDPWLQRLAYASRARYGAKDISDKILISRFKPNHRLKPMSLATIDSYRQSQLFATGVPTCPPVGRLPPLGFAPDGFLEFVQAFPG